MSRYFFIQSREPYSDARARHQYRLAMDLCEAGHEVTVLLVQNGVLPARVSAHSDEFEQLLSSGVTVLADEFSLSQREVAKTDLKPAVMPGDVTLGVDALLAGDKVMWN